MYEGEGPSACALHQCPGASPFSRAVFTWGRQVRLFIKRHGHGPSGRNSHHGGAAAGLAPGGGGEGPRHKRRAGRTQRGIVASPGREMLEMKYDRRLGCCALWEEPHWAFTTAEARPKPLGGQAEVTGTEIQPVRGDGWAVVHQGQRGSCIHSLNKVFIKHLLCAVKRGMCQGR